MVHQNLSDGPSVSGARAVRIWDEGVTWRELSPAREMVDWTALDRVVGNALAGHPADVLYVFGSTPQWAAEKVSAGELYGPGSASHPRDDRDYLDYVRRTVKRYRGKITSYQIWNEADLPDFYNGRPEKLAALTAKAYRTIKSADPAATVVAAGLVPRPGRFEPGTFEDRYLSSLQGLGWPVDGFAVSLYPERPDPGLRADYLSIVRKALTRLGSPVKSIWESELNYGSADGRPLSEKTQRRLVAVSYLDSIQLGLERSYWYSWTTQLPNLAVRMMRADGSATPAAVAFRTTVSWLADVTTISCSHEGALMRCLLDQSANAIYYASTSSGATTIPAPPGSRRLCRLDGRCGQLHPGDAIRVDGEPVLFRQ